MKITLEAVQGKCVEGRSSVFIPLPVDNEMGTEDLLYKKPISKTPNPLFVE